MVFLAALGLRLIPVLFTRQLAIGLDDMFQYDMLARSLALGNGFRWYAPADLARLAPYLNLDASKLILDPRGQLTTFRAPLYPAFLALIYWINGINDGRFFATRLVQAVLGAALAPLTYLLGWQLASRFPSGVEVAGNKSLARAAAWVAAVYPMLIIFPLALATENLFFPLVLLTVILLLRAVERPSVRIFLLAGLTLGLAALTRSIILGFGLLSILWVWLALKQRRGALLMTLALIVTILPWMVRNSLLAHRPTGIETSLGYNLYVGYHPLSNGTFTFGPSLDLLSILDDEARDRIGTQQAIHFIEQDPGRFPYLALRRLGYFFDLEWRAFTYFYVNSFLGFLPPGLLVLILAILGLPFVIVALSAAGGTVLLPWRPQSALLLLLFLGYLLPHVLILSEERFHLTLIPFFAVLASAFWSNGPAAVHKRGPVVMAAVGLVVVLLLANWVFDLLRYWPTLAAMLGPNGNQLYLPY